VFRQEKDISATGASSPILLDFYHNPFNVSVFVEFYSGATATYKLQYTGSNLNDSSYPSATWFDDTVNIVSGTTTAKSGNFAFPVYAVRLNVASISGTIRLVVMGA